MLELIAQGPQPAQRWRQDVPVGGPYLLGRGFEADFPVPWDREISRRHLLIHAEPLSLTIGPASEKVNPVFVAGELQTTFTVSDGGRFAIGETSFSVRRKVSAATDRAPIEQASFDSQALRGVRFDDADRRIEVLTRLPDVILGTSSTEEIHGRLVDLILTGVPRADAAAIVTGQRPENVEILHQDRRRPLDGRLQPSGRLVAECLQSNRSVLHVWDAATADSPFTVAAESDWAFCTPLTLAGSQTAGLYVAGRIDATALLSQRHVRHALSEALQADVKFAELVAEILRSVLRLKSLERQTAGLKQFLAPPILAALGEGFDAKLLEPRECDATVLF
nr:FHA domain-containing protein [Planctomycetota bacterium]